MFHNVREAGSLREGISRVVANANLDRFLGLVLLISLTVGTFLVMQEISRAMGKELCSGCFSSRRWTSRDRNHWRSEERISISAIPEDFGKLAVIPVCTKLLAAVSGVATIRRRLFIAPFSNPYDGQRNS